MPSFPRLLALVRHGESEGNVAVRRSKRGDDSLYTEQFLAVPSQYWRLTDEGRRQAAAAGRFLAEMDFDRFHCSPLVRAQETAGCLGLDLGERSWHIERRVRERDWGDVSNIPRAEYQRRYPENFARKTSDPLYWRPPGGESFADMRHRVGDYFRSLSSAVTDEALLVVTHESLIEASFYEIGEFSDHQAHEWHARSGDIENGEIFLFTRVDPSGSGEEHRRLEWFRRVCPWRETDSGWARIERRGYSNEELLAYVATVDPLLADGAAD